MVEEKLLFVCHRGMYAGDPAGILMSECGLPIAASHSSENHPDGFHAFWQATLNVDEFFNEGLGIDHLEASGLWVYEVQYNDALLNNEEDWTHLAGGTVRRPTTDELVPLAAGKPPWEDGRLL